jgi:nucleotide-binding universal stress UspA family protein
MGITGTSKLEEVLIGSTATSVIKHTTTPVIVVPENATYTTIGNIMLATDYKKVAETTPVEPIKEILEATGAKLHIVNVYEGGEAIPTDKAYQQELLHSMLKDFNPEFHYESNDDFIEGINDFVDTHAIDLIITIPRKHGFFEGLFKESHTKKLAFHSHVPLMYIHEEGTK